MEGIDQILRGMDPAQLAQMMNMFQMNMGELMGSAQPRSPYGASGLSSSSPTMTLGQRDESNTVIGRSRRYREGEMELTGNLASLPPSIIMTANPVVPLKFEQPAGVWQGLTPVSDEAHQLSHFADEFASEAVMRAHEQALQGYAACSSQLAVSLARKALTISPVCPEAYNVLAQAAADTYEEALNFYEKAAELGPQMLKAASFKGRMDGHEIWQCMPLRAYYRALYGVANTLRKMGRYEESLTAYEQLLNADGNWYSWSSYVNVMALYPFVVLGAKGPKAVLDYMKSYRNTKDYFTYISSGVYWAGAYVLAYLLITEAKGVSVRADNARVTPDDNWAADGLDVMNFSYVYFEDHYNGVKSRPLFFMCHIYWQAVDMLLGDTAAPTAIQTTIRGAQKIESAGCFVYTTGAQWRSKPSVMERLRRYRNTLEVRSLLADLRQPLLEVDIKDIQKYMQAPGGFHTHTLEKDLGSKGFVKSLLYLLMQYPDGKEFSQDELKVLKWLLDAGCPVDVSHPNGPEDSPLQMACYQGYGPQAVTMLLEAGADPFRCNIQGLSAIAMTANQGNWREMQAVLQKMPHLKTANAGEMKYCQREGMESITRRLTVPEALIGDLFTSSCLICLAGGPKCMRCDNGIPHSPYADFFKYADVIIEEAGVRKLSTPVIEQMEAMCEKSRHAQSPFKRLQKQVLRAIERNKKGPAAKQPPQAGTSSSTTAAAAAAAAKSSTIASTAANTAGNTSGSAGAGSSSSSQPSASGQQKQRGAAAAAGRDECWGCGAKAGPDLSLKRCNGCKTAWYCSAPCQKAAWKEHKADCRKWAAEKAAAK